jgi:hypothetical protein
MCYQRCRWLQLACVTNDGRGRSRRGVVDAAIRADLAIERGGGEGGETLEATGSPGVDDAEGAVDAEILAPRGSSQSATRRFLFVWAVLAPGAAPLN